MGLATSRSYNQLRRPGSTGICQFDIQANFVEVGRVLAVFGEKLLTLFMREVYSDTFGIGTFLACSRRSFTSACHIGRVDNPKQ